MEDVKLSKTQIVNRLAANTAACWIMWEIRNLKDTFEDPNNYSLKANGMYKRPPKHFMADAIENMVNSLMKLIGIDHADPNEEDRRYDIFDTLDITLVQENGEVKFIIS